MTDYSYMLNGQCDQLIEQALKQGWVIEAGFLVAPETDPRRGWCFEWMTVRHNGVFISIPASLKDALERVPA